MSIVKIDAGLASNPPVFAQPVLNQIEALLDTYNRSAIIKEGYILKGSLFCIGGAMYITDSDTAISGTASAYVAITASGSYATASYTANINSAAWNESYHNYYDTAGVLYLFDESDAINDGFITTRYYAPTPTGEPNKLSDGNIPFAGSCSIIKTSTSQTTMSAVCPRTGIITIKYKIRVTNTSFNTVGQLYRNDTLLFADSTSSGTFVEKAHSGISVISGDIITVNVSSSSATYEGYGKDLILCSGIVL